jgi:SAM-dependent methyltransferase
MASAVCALSYWDNFASAYSRLGPPLRPSPEDVRFVEGAIDGWRSANTQRKVRALLLGVTPEFAKIRLSEPCSLLAIDNSLPMIRFGWAGDVPNQRSAACGDWLRLPCRRESCDVALGDGSLNCLRYPDAYRAAAVSLRDVLRPGGIVLLRSYVRPEVGENAETVFEDLWRGAIPTFHQFKFRLLTSLQRSAREGVAVEDVYRYWQSRRVDVTALAVRCGWEQDVIDTIHYYRDTPTVHTFPTESELRSVLLEYFEEETTFVPTYYLGDRCPTLLLRRRA